MLFSADSHRSLDRGPHGRRVQPEVHDLILKQNAIRALKFDGLISDKPNLDGSSVAAVSRQSLRLNA